MEKSRQSSTEKQLEQFKYENERMAFAQQVGSIGTFEWDLQRNINIWTPELEALYGLQPGEFGGNHASWLTWVHPEDKEQANASLQDAIHNTGVFETEFRIIRPDKQVRRLQAKGHVLYNEQQQPERMVGVNIDITERKEGEIQLARQAALLQASYDAFIVHDRQNRVLYWNHGATAMYGWTEEEILGKTLYQVLNTQFPIPLGALYELLETEPTWEGELIHTKRDGSRIVVASRWSRVEDPHTGEISYLEVNRDITEQKRTLEHIHFLAEASKQLVTAKTYQDALHSTAQSAVPTIADWCRVDLLDQGNLLERLTIVYPDISASAPLDPPLAQLAEKAIRTSKSILNPRISEQHLRELTRNEQEYQWLREQGAVSSMIVPFTVQNEAAGAITFVSAKAKRSYSEVDLAVAEELASRIALALEKVRLLKQTQEFNARLEQLVLERTEELARSYEKLRQVNTELQQSNQELQEFAYVASHDLQEPLRKIQAFGNLLEEEYGSKLEDGKAYLDRMRNAAGRMQRLINDLLTFSRVTTKAQPFTEVDLNEIAQDALDNLETRLEETRGKVEIEKLPTITADPSQMQQILQNLIGNALKFHKRDVPPRVKVYAEVSGDPPICKLYVEDNGIGFDEKYLDRIFTVFQRLHGRSEYEGTGIGLAVVRKIVERHGGIITAKSAHGEGATFIVMLPVHPKENPSDGGN